MSTVVLEKQERTLIKIARTLPPNRVEQLVDFARFLEAQILSEELLRDEDPDEIEADNARWDVLLESDRSQEMLTRLASEALAEHRAGKTKPMVFDDEGRIKRG